MQIALRMEEVKIKKLHKTTSLDILINVFMFISTLFIGADIFGINIGVNLRIDQLFLFIASFLMLLKDRFRLYKNNLLVLFAIFSFVSTLLSANLSRGIIFYFSFAFNIVFVFYLYTNYIRTYGVNKFIKLYRRTMYLQFLIVIVQYFLVVFFNYEIPFMPSYGTYLGIHRFALWFYEPSYFATYVSIWFTLSFFMFLVGGKKSFIKDVIMSFLMILISTSTSGFIGIFVGIVLSYIVWISKKITTKKIISLVLIIFLALIFKLVFNDIFNVFILRLFNSSLDTASGGRIEMWKETFSVFIDNPLFGVGPGNYGYYLGKDLGYVPSNVTLELLATVGIFASVFFYALNIFYIFKAFSKKCRKNLLVKGLALSLVTFLIVLQINQGYLRLYHWMLLGVIDGVLANVLRSNRKYRGNYGKYLY